MPDFTEVDLKSIWGVLSARVRQDRALSSLRALDLSGLAEGIARYPKAAKKTNRPAPTARTGIEPKFELIVLVVVSCPIRARAAGGCLSPIGA